MVAMSALIMAANCWGVLPIASNPPWDSFSLTPVVDESRIPGAPMDLARWHLGRACTPIYARLPSRQWTRLSATLGQGDGCKCLTQGFLFAALLVPR